jgi:rod shape-determining protein MreC
MRSLLRFIQKYYFFLLFIILEVIALSMFLNNHAYQRTRMLNSSNIVVSSVYNAYNNVTQYLSLKNANDELVKENLDFHNALLFDNIFSSTDQSPTLPENDFVYINARVINNSTNRKDNTITLNVGKTDGVSPEMAIVSPLGVVGITVNVSNHYCTALSLLNSKFSVSTKLQRSGYFGSLVWNNNNYRLAYLNEIPGHVDILVGDTLITSGYSAIFPEGIMVGTVHEFTSRPGDYFYSIVVDLAVDFKSLDHVYVINNTGRDEQLELEKLMSHD